MNANMRTWNFDDCTVTEDEINNCLTVWMEQDGEIRTQTVCPANNDDMAACIEDLDAGISPMGAWEDGVGRIVSWENADIEE